MPTLHLIVGDRVQIGEVTFKIIKAVGEYVDVRVDGADSGTIEINPDEHPDEEVAASVRDPNEAGSPVFAWPSWLKCAAIAMDRDGAWFGYSDESPVVDAESGVWTTNEIYVELTDMFNLTAFPNVSWEESLIKNPNAAGRTIGGRLPGGVRA